jgi:hypothetical protein
MGSWAILDEQRVWISPRAVAFTVVCEQCARLAESFPSVEGRLGLDAVRGTVECRRGHRLRVEREGLRLRRRVRAASGSADATPPGERLSPAR